MFEWYRLEDHRALLSSRRIMRYVLLYCTAGQGRIQVDENEFQLLPNDIITITSGQIHFLQNDSSAKGVVLEFSYDFFCKTDADIELIFHNGLFCHFGMNEVVRIGNPSEMSQLFENIRTDLYQKNYQYLIAVHAYLELVLIKINRAKIKRGDEIWKPDALFLKFLELIRVHFKQAPTLSYYAVKLQTTESKLNELAKLHTGKTAQMVIYGLIASEAQRLLTYEKLSVKEVAAELGFNDPFYFSNFFKKHTGVSPKGYRDKVLE